MSVVQYYANEKPIIFVIALFVVETVIAFPFVAAFKLAGLDIVPLRLIIPVVQSALMLWVIWHLGWFRLAGFTRSVRDIHIYWYPVILAFIPALFYGTVAIPAGWLTFYALALLFTGISEESFARGIALPALRSRGKWFALLFAALLFSIGHFVNLFFEDFGLVEMADKLLATFGFAILFGGVFIRTGNIWPLIVLHTLFDYSYLTSGTAGPYVAEPISIPLHAVLAVANIAYGVYVAAGADWGGGREEGGH